MYEFIYKKIATDLNRLVARQIKLFNRFVDFKKFVIENNTDECT